MIGSREFAADFAAELSAAGVGTYEVVGWIGAQGPAEYRGCAGSARSTTCAQR